MDALERLCAMLGPGQRLPTHREMAGDLGVTVATLTRAVGELTRRGILNTRTGSGTFVAPSATPLRLNSHSDGLVDLRINVPPVEPVLHIVSDTLAALAGSGQLLEYEPLGGSAASREAAALWLRLRDLPATAENVLVVNGAHEGLCAALRATTVPGDRVLCEALNYAGLRHIASLLQLELVGVPIDGNGLDIEAFARSCRETNAKVAILTPETQNPTTTSLNVPARQAIVEAARAASITLIENDIFGHLVGNEEMTLTRMAPERTIYVTSLSKCIAPGVRIGYVMAPPHLHEALREALLGLGWTSAALYSAIAERLILEGRAQACVKAQRAEALARARVARSCLGDGVLLGDDGPNGPKPVFHAWLSLPRGRHADRFAAELVSRQIIVSPAYHFSQTGMPAPEAIRFTLGYGTREQLSFALQRLAAALRQAGSPLTTVV